MKGTSQRADRKCPRNRVLVPFDFDRRQLNGDAAIVVIRVLFIALELVFSPNLIERAATVIVQSYSTGGAMCTPSNARSSGPCESSLNDISIASVVFADLTLQCDQQRDRYTHIRHL